MFCWLYSGKMEGARQQKISANCTQGQHSHSRFHLIFLRQDWGECFEVHTSTALDYDNSSRRERRQEPFSFWSKVGTFRLRDF